MHVKEPRTLIVKEKGLAPVFLDSRLEHPAGWICARYKSYHYYYYYGLVRVRVCDSTSLLAFLHLNHDVCDLSLT